MNDEIIQWCSLLSECVVFIDETRVNIEDLCAAGLPGAIVRVFGDPRDSVMIHVAPHDQCLGCVGGMISDAA